MKNVFFIAGSPPTHPQPSIIGGFENGSSETHKWNGHYTGFMVATKVIQSSFHQPVKHRTGVGGGRQRNLPVAPDI
jgi:hypothetical protein